LCRESSILVSKAGGWWDVVRYLHCPIHHAVRPSLHSNPENSNTLPISRVTREKLFEGAETPPGGIKWRKMGRIGRGRLMSKGNDKIQSARNVPASSLPTCLPSTPASMLNNYCLPPFNIYHSVPLLSVPSTLVPLHTEPLLDNSYRLSISCLWPRASIIKRESKSSAQPSKICAPCHRQRSSGFLLCPQPNLKNGNEYSNITRLCGKISPLYGCSQIPSHLLLHPLPP
jgi:hypothetical protein